MKNYRNSLLMAMVMAGVIISCSESDPAAASKPTAAFTFLTASNGLVTFINSSRNATSYMWTFGDGTSSTEISPSHTYSTNDSYTAQLKVAGPGGTSTLTQTVTVAKVISFIGTWMLLSTISTGCTGSDQNTNYNCTTDCETFEFTATTMTITMPGQPNQSSSYAVSGNTISYLSNGVFFTRSFIISGAKTLTLSFQDAPANGNCLYVMRYTRI